MLSSKQFDLDGPVNTSQQNMTTYRGQCHQTSVHHFSVRNQLCDIVRVEREHTPTWRALILPWGATQAEESPSEPRTWHVNPFDAELGTS